MNSKLAIIVAVIVVPLFCLALVISGVMVGYLTTASVSPNPVSASGSVDHAQVEAEILAIAAEYAGNQDAEAARQRLQTLGIPNEAQYVSFMVDRYIQEDQGAQNSDTKNLFVLAQALGVSTASMVKALATPTFTPSPTPPPTETPTLTPTTTPLPPTNTPEPSPTPAPTETIAPTEAPAVAPAEPPAPPTNTPEPTATPEPTKPAVDYVVKDAHMLPNPVYDSCPGAHLILVDVVDVNGAPIDGVTVVDTFNAVPPKISGEKGPGKLEYDLWKNGYSLRVDKNPDGSPAASQETPKLSSVDEDIPDQWLVDANYCRDLADCARRKASNSLCRGHYAYQVVFQRTY